MKKLTNESKARFFAQYWGNPVQYPNGNISDVNGVILTLLREPTGGAKLLLSSKEKISDEDKLKAESITNLFDIEEQRDECVVCVYLFLISKGYALDWFCPIENRIIPVQEQIDNGWITLKEE